MSKNLFQAEFRVHLTPDHPKADEFGFGKLIVWLYGYDEESAGAKAAKIAAFLPYELGAGKSFLFEKHSNPAPFEIECAKKAEIIGINFALIHFPIGADETEVFGNWPFLVPPLNVN